MVDSVETEAPRVVVERKQTVAVARLNRPLVRNAIDDAMRIALLEVIQEVSDDAEVRALVLTGEGKSFCAGGDIAAMRERLAAPPAQVAGNGWRRQRETHRMALGLHRMAKVTIAAVNGAAIGVGMDLALCCDFIIASETASFAMAHIVRGLIADGGGMYFLPRRVGLPRAKELIMTGRRLRAPEALELGIVDRVVPPDDLAEAALEWARELTQYSPTAIGLGKMILNRTFELEAEALFALGAEAQALCYTTEEHRTSIEAFLADQNPAST